MSVDVERRRRWKGRMKKITKRRQTMKTAVMGGSG